MQRAAHQMAITVRRAAPTAPQFWLNSAHVAHVAQDGYGGAENRAGRSCAAQKQGMAGAAVTMLLIGSVSRYSRFGA